MNKKLKKPQAHRIALYVRVSTEEQAKNPEGSIKSQEQRLRAHIALHNQESHFGDIVGVYVDAARSGKDTNRPELQRLLKAIRAREVSFVIVTELSRLSRSIRDFCDIWELMREHNCQFQSLREQFDTTTAAGETVLYTIANIAQFERKQTSERITANFRAREERGLANGGPVPLGYAQDKDNKGHLLIKEEDAKIVREAFLTFLKEGTLASTGKSLNERGYRIPRNRQGGGPKPRLGHFTIDNLYQMLSNQAYIGVRSYKVDGEIRKVKAVWKPLIEEGTFKKVQAIFKINRYRHKSHTDRRYPFLLSGVTFCAQCGDSLTGKSAHGNGGKIPYYEHSWATRRQSCLNKKIFDHKPRRILANKLESKVWEEILKLLEDPKVAQSLIFQAHKVHENKGRVKDAERLKRKVQGIEEQIDALAEHLSKIPKGLSPTPIFEQMQKLEALKTNTSVQLEELQRQNYGSDMPVSLKDYRGYLSTLRGFLQFIKSPELQSKLIRCLFIKSKCYQEPSKFITTWARKRFFQTIGTQVLPRVPAALPKRKLN